jgi:hypothetical protein
MVAVVRFLAAWLLPMLLACGAVERAPDQTAVRYVAAIGRDPLGAFALTSADFHRRHGLSIAAMEGWMWGADWEHLAGGRASAMEGLAAPEGDPSLDAARHAWLFVQSRHAFQEVPPGLQLRVLDVGVDGPHASVTLQVAAPRSAGFRQEVQLVRTSAGWRVDRVRQLGVARGDERLAFVTHPSEENRQRWMRAGG